ncbi:MAG: 50S ribosomal protein L23 [Oscillospiraceae bacterium]
MKAPQDIILKPIITERSMSGIMQGRYTFEVAKDANKMEIAEAVEKLFAGTKVDSVNTMNVNGKFKVMGKTSGYRKDWKKAIVTIKPDSKKIEFFESMM